MEPEEIMKILSEEGEKREVVKFTIPEGFTLEQIAERVAAQGLCTANEFMNAAENGNYGYRFLEQLPDRPKRLQGYLSRQHMKFMRMRRQKILLVRC